VVCLCVWAFQAFRLLIKWVLADIFLHTAKCVLPMYDALLLLATTHGLCFRKNP